MSRHYSKGNIIAEYGLIIALVALALIPAISYMGQVISNSYMQNGNIRSEGAQLFGLLSNGGGGGSGPASTVAAAAPSQFPGLSSKGQPVDNVYFNYNAKTGLVEILLPDGSAKGSPATSADGTKVLAQNMKDAVEKAAAEINLSETEKQQLNRVSDLAFELAEMEKVILEKYPKLQQGTDKNLYLFGSVSRKGNGFVRTAPPKGIPDIYGKYLEFSKEYETLAGQLPENDPRLAEVRKVIDVNSSLVTQLAYENFIEPQSDFLSSNSKFYRDFYAFLRNQATGEMVVADGVDITKITAEEAPVETVKAGKKIKTAEDQAETIMNGGGSGSASKLQ